MFWDRVGLAVIEWGGGKRWDTLYTAHTHVHYNNHRFIRPSAISTLGNFSLSQNTHPIPVQPDFNTVHKSGHFSLKHKLFPTI